MAYMAYRQASCITEALPDEAIETYKEIASFSERMMSLATSKASTTGSSPLVTFHTLQTAAAQSGESHSPSMANL